MARDTNPQTPQTCERQWPADPKEPSDETEKPLRSSPHPNSQRIGKRSRGGPTSRQGAGLNNRPAPVLPAPSLNPLCTGLLGPLLNPPLPKGAQTPKRVCFKLISGTARGGAGEGYPQPGRGFLRFVY